MPLPLLYWLWALLAILWLRPKLRRRPAYWDSREKGLASMLRRHTEAQTSCNVERGQIHMFTPLPITHRIGDLHVGHSAGVQQVLLLHLLDSDWWKRSVSRRYIGKSSRKGDSGRYSTLHLKHSSVS